MRVLIVYGHPNPRSFNHAVVEEFSKELADAGHEYEIGDLYAEGFDFLVSLGDLGPFSGQEMPRDVRDQQRKVSAADGIVPVGPIHGWSIRAILKGWIDRVLSHGFAYQLDKNGDVKGLLQHRKALLIVTTGFSQQIFRGSGAEDALEKVYLSLTLELMAVRNTDLVPLYAAEAVGKTGRKEYVQCVYRLVRELTLPTDDLPFRVELNRLHRPYIRSVSFVFPRDFSMQGARHADLRLTAARNTIHPRWPGKPMDHQLALESL